MKISACLVTILLLAGCASTAKLPESSEVIIRTGSGLPAVVMQAGLGVGKETWNQIVPALSRDHIVFAYDRPGTGTSPAIDAPRDPCTIATEQRALLKAAGIPPPYILVGHSLGGLYQYVYAKLYPSDVAGFVLVDPTHPRNWEAVQSEQPEGAALIKAMKVVSFNAMRRGEFDSQTACLDKLDMTRPLTQPGRVLVSGRAMPMANAKYERKRLELSQDWPRMTGVAHVDMIWDSSHFIQKEDPEDVIAAIRQVASSVSGRSEARDRPVLQSGQVVTLARKSPLTITPAKTSQADVEATWGKPAEILSDGSRNIWVYTDKREETPWAISLIPVIGDIVDAVGLVEDMQDHHELILQFDERGLVSRYKLRKLD
jgi:pimeloyl-ACP methyl ester carboxylesterase